MNDAFFAREEERRSRPGAATLRALAGLEDGALARFLPRRRWFGAKGRRLARARVIDAARLGAGRAARNLLVYAIVEVEFEQGAPERYGLPLAIGAPDDLPALACVREIEDAGRRIAISDAVDDEEACRALLATIARGETRATRSGGRLIGESRVPLSRVIGPPPIERIAARPLGAEQSNTSIVYAPGGTARVVVKLLRRLEEGESTEVEIGRHLAQTGFAGTPTLLGQIRWVPAHGDVSTLAIAQTFAASDGDGFGLALADLRRELSRAERATRGEPEMSLQLRALGALIGEMHQALGADDGAHDRAFAIEALDEARRADLVAGARALLADTLAFAEARGPTLPEPARSYARAVVAEGPRLARALADPSALPLDLPLTRVHGDLHLGQALHARRNGRWLILDFEGEPDRPLPLRRAKTSPLRDVATMLRSIDYAAMAVIRAMEPAAPEAIHRARAWHDRGRAALLDGYFAHAYAARRPLVPRDRGQCARTLRFFEIDKAMRELAYEIDHRPEWIDIPLAAIARLTA